MLPRSSYFYPFAMMALNTAVCQWIGFLVLGPDEDTGMWVIEWDCDANGHQVSQVIDIDTIIWCAHLIGVYGPDPVNTKLMFSNSLLHFTLIMSINMQITIVLK